MLAAGWGWLDGYGGGRRLALCRGHLNTTGAEEVELIELIERSA